MVSHDNYVYDSGGRLGGVFTGTLPSGKPIPVGWWIILGVTALWGFYRWRDRYR